MKNKKELNISYVISLAILILFLCSVFRVYQLKEENVELKEEMGYVELIPCPLCDHEVKLNPVNDSFYIECDNFLGKGGCGLTTGYYDSKNELIKQWNGMK